MKINWDIFISENSGVKNALGQNIILDKAKTLKALDSWTTPDNLKNYLKSNESELCFSFRDSFVIFTDCIIPNWNSEIHKISLEEVSQIEIVRKKGFFSNKGFYYKGEFIGFDFGSWAECSDKLFPIFQKYIVENDSEKIKKQQEQEIILSKRNEELNDIILQLDNDGNGIVDIAESNDVLLKLVNAKQSKIIAIDKEYLQKFVRIANHLKYKKESIQGSFSILLEEKERFESEKKKKNELLTDPEIDNLMLYFEDLDKEIFEYNLLLVHSLNMLVALTDDENLLTFYQIYEVFDQLNIFNSSWENGVFQKLNGIRDGIDDLSRSVDYLSESVNSLGIRLSSKIDEMNYITQDSFKNLQNTVTKKLDSINSNLEYNNILSIIQTYQLHRISKHNRGR